MLGMPADFEARELRVEFSARTLLLLLLLPPSRTYYFCIGSLGVGLH